MISEKLTNLMNAARQKYTVVGKLKVDDLKRLLLAKQLFNETPKMSGATDDGGWQRYQHNDNPVQIYPNGNIGYILAKKGQTIYQAVDLRTDGKFQNTFISFYQNGVGHHNVVPDIKVIDDNTIRLSASYTCESDGEYLMLDLNQLSITGGTYYEVGNFKAYLSELGGVIRRLLTDVLPSRLEVAA